MKRLVIAMILITVSSHAWTADEAAESQADAEVSEAMTEEDVEAELQRIEAALGESDQLKEFVPSKPLAADLPIALPSDM